MKHPCTQVYCHGGWTRRAQRGFTLVEAAIVLVIAALLIAGVLSSTNILRSARVGNLVSLVAEIRTAVAGFQDRYGFMPGDCPATVADCSLPLPAPGGDTGTGDGSGLIDGAINLAFDPASEVDHALRHLFVTGFLSKIDAQDPQNYVRTPWGRVQLANSAQPELASYPGDPANALIRHVVVFTNLPCDVATELDLKIDDGNVFSGRAMSDPLGVAGCPDSTLVPFYAVSL